MSSKARGIVPPTLFTTMSRRPKASTALSASAATSSRSFKSAGTTTTLRPDRLDLSGHVTQLVLSARRDEDVGACFGQTRGRWRRRSPVRHRSPPPRCPSAGIGRGSSDTPFGPSRPLPAPSGRHLISAPGTCFSFWRPPRTAAGAAHRPATQSLGVLWLELEGKGIDAVAHRRWDRARRERHGPGGRHSGHR